MHLRILISAICLSLILFGCASGIGGNNQAGMASPASDKSTISGDIASPVPDKAKLSGCLRTQRDLTVSWKQRRYWCSNVLRREALQEHNIKHLAPTDTSSNSLDVMETAQKTSSPSPDSSNDSSDPAQGVVLASASSEDGMVQYITLNEYIDKAMYDEEQDSSGIDNNDSLVRTNNRVDFIRTWEVLDDNGTQQVLSLIQEARQAKRITLLGLYEPDELAKVKAGPEPEERFSVGRSLSVRERWREEGVDVSKVKILHHNEDQSGRHVKVSFYD
jgi:hypothetical protein